MQNCNHVRGRSLPAWKKGLVISLALSIAATFFVFFSHFEEDTLLDLLQLRASYLFLASVMTFSLWIIEGFRIKLLVAVLGHEKRISLADAIKVYLTTFFFAAVTPFAAGEWPAHIVALHRRGLSIGEASAVTIARAFFTKMIFTITALIFLLFYRDQTIPAFLNTAFLYAVFISFSLSLLFFFLLWRPSLLEWLLQKCNTIPPLASFLSKNDRGRRILFFLKNEIERFALTAHGLNRWKTGALAAIILLTIVYWFSLLSIAPVLLAGLNKHIPYLKSLSWQFLIQLVLPYIPIPGGSGVIELSLAGLYKFFVPSSMLGLFIFSWRFFTYYILLAFGGLAALESLKPQF